MPWLYKVKRQQGTPEPGRAATSQRVAQTAEWSAREALPHWVEDVSAEWSAREALQHRVEGPEGQRTGRDGHGSAARGRHPNATPTRRPRPRIAQEPSTRGRMRWGSTNRGQRGIASRGRTAVMGNAGRKAEVPPTGGGHGGIGGQAPPGPG